MKRIVTVVGARPQFIKCAAVSHLLRRSAVEILVHTGQHYDEGMSEVFFRELEIPRPDHHLGIGSGPHGRQTGAMLAAVEDVLLREHPDAVLVYGDTNSTLAGALAAAKTGVPVAHVEAGLRSFNRRMPEEVNRVLADHLSRWLFCPAENAARNLEREGIAGDGVRVVGDVMHDVVLRFSALAESGSRILETLGLAPKGYALATVHRAENADDPVRLGAILRALDALAESGPPVVLPLHPRTRRRMQEFGLRPRHVRLLDPASYLDMLRLEGGARLILTDSGGVQKEAYWLNVPCVTLRDETEWVETVAAGWNRLAGTDPDRILAAASAAGTEPAERPPLFGDGRAAGRIVEALTAE